MQNLRSPLATQRELKAILGYMRLCLKQTAIATTETERAWPWFVSSPVGGTAALCSQINTDALQCATCPCESSPTRLHYAGATGRGDLQSLLQSLGECPSPPVLPCLSGTRAHLELPPPPKPSLVYPQYSRGCTGTGAMETLGILGSAGQGWRKIKSTLQDHTPRTWFRPLSIFDGCCKRHPQSQRLKTKDI